MFKYLAIYTYAEVFTLIRYLTYFQILVDNQKSSQLQSRQDSNIMWITPAIGITG